MSQTEDTRQVEQGEHDAEAGPITRWIDSMPQPNAETVIGVVLDPEGGLLYHDWGLLVVPFDQETDIPKRHLDEGIAVVFMVKFAHDGPMQGIPARIEVDMPHKSAAALGLSLLSAVMGAHPECVGSLPPLYQDLEHLAEDLRAYREAHGLQPLPRREWSDLEQAG